MDYFRLVAKGLFIKVETFLLAGLHTWNNAHKFKHGSLVMKTFSFLVALAAMQINTKIVERQTDDQWFAYRIRNNNLERYNVSMCRWEISSADMNHLLSGVWRLSE